MGVFTTNFLGQCDSPIITQLSVSGGFLVITFSVTASEYLNSRYEIATDVGFTNIVNYNVGTHTSPVTTTLEVVGYSTLYVRMKKYCTNGSETYESNWSNIMIWSTAPSSNVYVELVGEGSLNGTRNYKLHVENETFIGFVNMTARKGDNTKNARGEDGYGGILNIPNNDINLPYHDYYKSIPITLPVGIYTANIRAIGIAKNVLFETEVDSAVTYSYIEGYYNGLPSASAEAHLYVPAIIPPEELQN